MTRFLRFAALAAACATIAACNQAGVQAAGNTAAAPAHDGAASLCNAEMLGDLVGQTATQKLGADAVRRSGSHSMRWLVPGMAVTMDYRQDRLNIELDETRKIVGSRCG